MSKPSAAFLLALLWSSAGVALDIREMRDEFTGDTYIAASGLKLCQVKTAGFAAPCAMLQLVWLPADPDVIGVRLDQSGIADISEIAVRIDGAITRYGADIPTGFDYNRSIARMTSALAWTSSNTFALPVSALEAITRDPQNGMMRVSGQRSVTDYDFYRKANARGVPADELRAFLLRIKASAQ